MQLGRLASIGLIAAIVLSAGNTAYAARTLLADFLKRKPAGAGELAMSRLKLEARLLRVQEADRTGVALDYQVAEIDRLAAEGVFLERQLESEMGALGGYDEAALKDYQARRPLLSDSEKFQSNFPSTNRVRRIMTLPSPRSRAIARVHSAPPTLPR